MDAAVSQLIDLALAEDIGPGDVTSTYFVPADRRSRAYINAREDGVLAGTEVAAEVFRRVSDEIEVRVMLEDGSKVSHGALVIEVSGPSRAILTAERTALNFLQRLSGVATLTSRFVKAVSGTDARILDTRKTTPGWRLLEKAAVLAGGGTNHRMGLYDRAMVKDNHLVAEGKLEYLQQAIVALKKDHPGVGVELEADHLEQVKDFLSLTGVDYILLDNMTLGELREAVQMRKGASPSLEASGGVNLTTVRGIAETGVDYISVGAVTHSAVGLDLGLDFVEEK
ncbi:carboxylating nicotinate-nucleotide diphosphorylase [Roseibacillus persicicus]|uniref:Probable nicotinate-nucleotide pyrophosphorylase [carboxylating] n=1 Tax=Roseibacillus persicicus TaxID=454148 RepID=A0A918TXC3_9BACT|nr:carboxylating nicotinate-nucleotide diphosphorylase [Roseibacillus persicicus]MDQ8188814.1 carboxylating nicotinate-nucleotide diphosphorylase [Roseibacillus persicicus]GHC66461.1 nicotinate-nucleotide pyrophosphorylase [carboxylating] [Roseibacillus persicicus]